VIHRLELFRFSFAADRARKLATTTIDGCFASRNGSCDVEPYVKRDEKTIASGRPSDREDDRRLFKPSQCRRRRHARAWARAFTASTLISTSYAQSRQVPQHFNKYSRTSTTRSARFSRRAPAVLTFVRVKVAS